uniref:Addiction module toxin, RelE/StbE family n=1 Tax=Pliocardia stearnsii symbiont TaxID=596092 RepID=A0A1Q2SSB0_UNCXX|nr:addiction module toxin, RelE/StbE family [Pliocardia stearnsii symbiont]
MIKLSKTLKKRLINTNRKKYYMPSELNLPITRTWARRLVSELSPYFRIRIGSYRVIYEIIEEQVIITIIKIKHRKEVYRKS